MLARKVIRNEALGLNGKGKPEHTQYVVMMPVIVAMLLSIGIVRFVGMGTGNRGLYITGGVCLVAGMTLSCPILPVCRLYPNLELLDF